MTIDSGYSSYFVTDYFLPYFWKHLFQAIDGLI